MHLILRFHLIFGVSNIAPVAHDTQLQIFFDGVKRFLLILVAKINKKMLPDYGGNKADKFPPFPAFFSSLAIL
jgi:hypothetical protein